MLADGELQRRQLHGVVKGLFARGLRPWQIASRTGLRTGTVEDILAEPAAIEGPPPLEAHYRWWASLSRAHAKWLGRRGLSVESFAASRQADQFTAQADKERAAAADERKART